MCGERWEGKEQVFGAMSDDLEVFRKGGGRVNLLGNFLVCKGRDKRVLQGVLLSTVGDVAFECFHVRW